MPLRLAIIGLGRWGPNHVRNFQALKNCVVVTAADPAAPARDRIRSIYETIECVSDWRAAIARPDVDAVVVSTPTATHFTIVQEALQAGKHVLCEKPLTASSPEAWRLVHLAREQKRVLMVGHVFLFNGGIEYLADAVRRRQAGPIFYLNAIRTNLGPFRGDVNAAWDLASHDIYILNYILDRRPHAVSALGGSYLRRPVEDIVFLTLQYPDGVLGHIHVSWLDPKKVRQITVVGEMKMITWDEFGLPGPIAVYDRSVVRDPVYDTFGEFQLLTREGDVVMPRIKPEEPLAAQARTFAERCRQQNLDLHKADGAKGAEVVDVLESASRSLAHGGALEPIHYGE